jgi:3'-5' exoribonuclease
VDGKVWSDNITAELEAGRPIEVVARVDEYRGEIQLNLQRYEVISPEQFDPSDYVRTTEIDTDSAFDEMFNWQDDEFDNPFYIRLLREFYENESFRTSFTTSPAASRHHHNYGGGLAEHTYEVWGLARKMAEHYGEKLNRDLVLAGAALHDVGKVRCYTLTAGVSEHTDVGNLLNHLFISASMVSNLWDRIMDDSVGEADAAARSRSKALLLHLILSHHGKKEWGSPVIPQLPEAMLLHYCDQMSATMWTCFDAVENAPEGQDWTEKLWLMDQPRSLFVDRDVE